MPYVSCAPENMRSWHVVTCIYITWSVYNTQLILTQACSCLLALLVENTESEIEKWAFLHVVYLGQLLCCTVIGTCPLKRVSRKLRPQTQKLKPLLPNPGKLRPPKNLTRKLTQPPPPKKNIWKTQTLKPARYSFIIYVASRVFWENILRLTRVEIVYTSLKLFKDLVAM